MSAQYESQLRTLQCALESLTDADAANGAALRSALRTAERSADDGECLADEIVDESQRDALLRAVSSTRLAIRDTRISAKKRALELAHKDRSALLGDGEASNAQNAPESDAAKIAQDITASLRRSTAIMQQEIARTNATGEVSCASTRATRRSISR